jgi:hypothetical protein
VDLAKIEKRRVEVLQKLSNQYYYWDKAAKTIGFIGLGSIILLVVIIFGNDIVKLFYFYLNEWRQYWRKETKKQIEEENLNKRKEEEEQNERIRIEYSDRLEEDLERVYFQLVKANVKNHK